jgi:RNA polymerase sigma-70 factor (ECF subfamily)
MVGLGINIASGTYAGESMGMKSLENSSSSLWQANVPAGSQTVAEEPDWATVSDNVLVEHARNRDAAAFDSLLARHRPMLARVCAGLVHDQEAVLEILQEVYLCAWQNLSKFEGRSQVSSWLYRIAANACLMFLRRRKRLLEVALEDEARIDRPDATAYCGIVRGSSLRGPDQLVESQELRRSLQEALDTLPPHLRQTFFLRYIDGLSDGESARVLGTTVSTVKTRLYRARITLRANLRSTWLLYDECKARPVGYQEDRSGNCSA